MSPLTFAVTPDAVDPWLTEYWRADAFRRHAVVVCDEATGGEHSWMAEVEPLDEGGAVQLSCEACPAGIDDLYPDGIDLLVGEVDGVPVNYGRARSLLGFSAPVNVDIEVWHTPGGPWGGPEWDVDISVSTRGAS